jgi:Ca2+-binding EF-hand superfamily protein
MIARMDSDADGKLTKAEMEASMANRRRPPPDFDSIDTNHDGFVTVEEMVAVRPPPMRGRGMPPAP